VSTPSGLSAFANDAWQVAGDGQFFYVEQYPVISALSAHATGPNEGGAPLTITGSGFRLVTRTCFSARRVRRARSSASRRRRSNACRQPRPPRPRQASDTKFSHSRGLLYQAFKKGKEPFTTSEREAPYITTILTDGAHSGSVRASFGDDRKLGDNYFAEATGFFISPRNTTHTFLLRGDDRVQLHLDGKLIAEVESFSDSYWEHMSAPIALEAARRLRRRQQTRLL
jgi:hypothetical protein